jgi:hypothetical protein
MNLTFGIGANPDQVAGDWLVQSLVGLTALYEKETNGQRREPWNEDIEASFTFSARSPWDGHHPHAWASGR